MKKLFAMILAAMMILCSCAFAETTDNSLQAILDKGTLVLGLDASFEPMGYTNMDGEIVGYDIDLAKEVCARLGVELVVQPIEWAAKELELSSGNIDCIWNGMSITPERQESMALSEAYMNNQIVLLVCDDSLKSKDDLAGKKMGVQSGSFAEEVLETYEQYADYYASLDEVLDYQDYETAIMDMKNGQIDGIMIDLVVVNAKIKNLEDDSLKIIDTFEDDLYAIGFRKDDLALRDKVNEILNEMAADGTLAKISETWFGSDISLVGKEAE